MLIINNIFFSLYTDPKIIFKYYGKNTSNAVVEYKNKINSYLTVTIMLQISQDKYKNIK